MASGNDLDVTEAIRKSVENMIARAAVHKKDGSEFNVDLNMCKDFIEQQIELVPPTVSSKPDENVIYRYVSIVRNGIPTSIQVPVSHKYTSDHTTEHSSSCETDANYKGAASVDAKLQGTDKANVTGELKKKDTIASEEVHKKHEEHHYGERNVPGNADVEAFGGRCIYNLQLELRALKKAKLEVFRKFDIGPQAGLGIGAGVVGGVAGGAAGGALGGAAIGVAVGTVVPVVGNIVGGVVGGVAGAVVGGVGGGGAAGGIGVGAVGGRRALDTVTLTAEDIFEMNDSDTKGTVTKGAHIHCIINYPYVADFDDMNVYAN